MLGPSVVDTTPSKVFGTGVGVAPPTKRRCHAKGSSSGSTPGGGHAVSEAAPSEFGRVGGDAHNSQPCVLGVLGHQLSSASQVLREFQTE
eukprot:8388467-Pyramimonas_sp.AAC.1